MDFILRALSLNDQPLTEELQAPFDASGGSIGRADHNTLALPDPERMISRIHAEITRDADGQFRLTCVSRANPILVAGNSLGFGESTLLRPRDMIRIGGYLIEMQLPQAQPFGELDDARTVIHVPNVQHTPPVATPAPLAAARAVPPAVPVAPAPGPAWPVDDPFADLLPPPASHHGQIAAVRPTPAPVVADVFDPFAAPAPVAAPPRPAWPQEPVLPPPSGSIDELFGLGGPASGDDPMAAFMRGPSGPAPAHADVDEIDPTGFGRTTGLAELFDERIELQIPPQPVVPEPFAYTAPPPPPVLRPAPTPAAQRLVSRPMPLAELPPIPVATRPAELPEPEPKPEPEPEPDPVPLAATPAVAADALLAAFCRGAGIEAEVLARGLTPELMEQIGAMLRGAIDGTQQLMAIRNASRVELHAQVTQIRTKGNNPLKFTPDGAAALEQLLRPTVRGFLGGPEAMADAMHDLIGHSIGTMAGMRAALEGVLDRFVPAALEQQVGGASVLGSLVPMSRRARLWELYLQHYGQIRSEAQDDFHSLFGRAFLAAYEEQLERLRQQRHG
ncbi:MAG: hypothetical protein RJA44_2127 [Pseudomonadota bacterium]